MFKINVAYVGIGILVLMLPKILLTSSYESSSWIVLVSFGVCILYFLANLLSNIPENTYLKAKRRFKRNVCLSMVGVAAIITGLVIYNVELNDKLSDTLSLVGLIITLATNEIAPKSAKKILKKHMF